MCTINGVDVNFSNSAMGETSPPVYISSASDKDVNIIPVVWDENKCPIVNIRYKNSDKYMIQNLSLSKLMGSEGWVGSVEKDESSHSFEFDGIDATHVRAIRYRSQYFEKSPPMSFFDKLVKCMKCL